MRRLLLMFSLWFLVTSGADAQQKKTRDELVRDDREKVSSEGFWIYNDLPLAFEKAKESGKPILVVLRCIPCEECVKLDDDLVDRDPVLHPLLERFVCVRVVSTNGLDLTLFQYDTDQSFAVFMLNADRSIYGRFGTRSHRTEWVGDVSLKGLGEALSGALDLHAAYPANKSSLEPKTGTQPLFNRPELFPSLKDKYTDTINYDGAVAKSCIHCHQIGDAVRDYYREKGEKIPEDVLNPYPHPKSLGLVLDPNSRATVKEVVSGSIAHESGLQAGDQISTLNSQPILSIADVQWVLHKLPADGAIVSAQILRGQSSIELQLSLPSGWRRLDDISWRVSAWGMRRMVTGGLLLKVATPEERLQNRLPVAGMALRAEHVGQFGPHAAAKNEGFLKDDFLVSYDGRRDLLTDSDLLRYGVTEKTVGESVPVEIVRQGKQMSLKLPIQQ